MKWVRTAVLALIITAIAIAGITHATTWVFWVGAPNANNPSNGTSTTWGPYWKDYVFLYSTQPVRWEVSTTPYWGPPFISIQTTGVDFNPFGSSGYETWVALSSAYSLSGYVYQGTVGAYSNAAIGSTYTFSSGYQYFVAVAWYSVGTETCGQLYFHADVENTATSTAMFYGTYIIANGTWSYVTFFSEAVPSGSWFNPAVPGPNTCFKGYYVYIATIAVNTTETTVGTAQISIGTTSEGTSYTPGTQYSWSVSPASGDVIVVPWTSNANPHVVVGFIQQVVNTAGSSTSGTFILSFPTYMGDLWNNFYSTYLTSSMFVFAYDNDTGYFPQSTITAAGCPSGVYALPATISPSVTQLLSCSGISPPPNGIAIYPTDYGKYASSPASYNPPVGYLVTFSYTDSAGNTYSMSDFFAVSATVYLYMTRGSYSITTRQVSFPLQTNLTLFSFQPTNQYVYSQLTAPGTTVSNNRGGEGYVLLIPPGYVKNNPYWFGVSNWFALPNAVFSTYSAVTMVFWVYQPPNGQGGLFTQVNTYPLISYWGSWLYIRNGYVYYSDYMGTLSAPIGTGWHMITVEVWANSTSGPYYETMYVDGQYIGTASSSLETQLGRSYTYGVIGMVWLGGGGGYFFYNGTIAYFAIYNTVLNSSQVQELYQVGFPNTLFSNNLVVAYVLSNTTYYVYDGVSHFYVKPYFANQQILSQLGITNASLITITPLGQVGWVPFTQWQPVTNYGVISYCKLMRYYMFNYLGGSKYQVVLVTNQNMNQFPLDYQFLITSGSGSQSVLPVLAYGNTNTFTNTTTATPAATAFLPVCDAPPSNVPVAIETTAVTPVCNTNNIGYTATYTEKLPNGTTYTYTLTYILGQNATTLPPALVPTYILAYPYALMLAVLLIIVIVMYRFGDLGMRNSLILAGATAVVTVLAYLGVGNPYASFNLSCPNANAPVTVTVPLPQNLFLATTWLGIIAIILIIASLMTEYALY